MAKNLTESIRRVACERYSDALFEQEHFAELFPAATLAQNVQDALDHLTALGISPERALAEAFAS